MSYYLFLDDIRVPEEVTWVNLPQGVHWEISKSYYEFETMIRNHGVPKYVSYDCDLCDEHYESYFRDQEHYPVRYRNFKQKCGIDCVEHLIAVCAAAGIPHPQYSIHTKNNHAGPHMDAIIKETLPILVEGEETIPDYLKMITPKGSVVPEYGTYNDSTISGFFGQYRFLSNFFPARVNWKGHEFPSVEVGYQAAKCKNESDMEKFLNISSPAAKRIGKGVEIRPDWEHVKLKIMAYLVIQKFSFYPDLKAKLLSTGDKNLVEANNWGDRIWGVSFKKNQQTGVWDSYGGANNLGKILCEVRALLKKYG